LAMGVPDFWIKLIKDLPDEQWNVSQIFHELKSHRNDEKTISYAESHDQALVGDKTIFFRLIDKEIYTKMAKNTQSLVVDRGIALHKMIRLVTIATAGAGYLNFMGNEFGHPEWIDFPREGNGWSYKYARRQWNLADDKTLKYHYLSDFDKAMINTLKKSEIYAQPFPDMVHADEGNQILVFTRGNLLFIFSFNPFNSFPAYDISVSKGAYQVILSTDDEEFGGSNRIDKNYIYNTKSALKEMDSKSSYLTIYIPARTAMVLRIS